MSSSESIAPSLLTNAEIQAAQESIAPYLHRTPMISSSTLSEELGCPVHLKLENLQKTGSFKPRGAFHKLLSLSPETRAQGVVGVSGGNHAQGLAYAARSLGIAATICMPKTTPPNYLRATEGYGAEIVFAEDIRAAFAAAARLQAEGRVFVHPFDDPLVAAGQGTVALEMLEDLPHIDRVYISIGGGGLIAGMATAFRHALPDIQIIGVETAGADVMARSLTAGERVEMPAITSLAKTLGAPQASPLTFDHVQALVDEVIVVDDTEAVMAMAFLLERTKNLVEPAAACCLAAARRHTTTFAPDETVALLLCGGNVSVADLARWTATESSGRAG